MTTVPFIPSYETRETYLNARYSVAVLAADQGPQADRDPVHPQPDVLLPDRRGRGHADADRADEPARVPAVSDDTYNKMFTTHGVMMVFFFLIPSIPATLGNFLVPLMIGAKDLAFPQDQPAQLVPVHHRRR